jgi:hypothetical protein
LQEQAAYTPKIKKGYTNERKECRGSSRQNIQLLNKNQIFI